MNISTQQNSINKTNLGIYIHIPFCVKKCDYCDFLSSAASSIVKQQYVKALINEIYSYQDIAKNYIVKTIFIGGGTPSSLDEGDIALIMEVVNEVFTIDWANKETSNIEGNHMHIPEITIECNPGTLTKKKLEVYKQAGINRLSIGLQSANNEELKLLGRIHTFEEFQENYHLAREVGYTNINIDLMSALPGQTLESWSDTLNKVICLNPEHISAYSLIIEEGTPFFKKYGDTQDKNNTWNQPQTSISSFEVENQRQYALPSEEVDRAIYYKTKELLEGNGYGRYEISNYARKGNECIHNTMYWRRGEYLGVGLGSSSLMNNTRFHNEDCLDDYIYNSSDFNKLRRDKEQLTRDGQMEEFMFLGLRMCEGINKMNFKLQFGVNIDKVYGSTIQKLVQDKLLYEDADRIFLTDRGIDISNYVLTFFLID